MGYIIKRAESEEIKSKKYWLLLYGRRKVGKTFLLRDLCGLDNFYSVKKDLSIVCDGRNISHENLFSEIKSLIEKNKVIVIDEFQRLAEGRIEDLVSMHPKGKLILSGSSLRIVKKVFEPNSPLLGFFTPVKIGFIKPTDAIIGLKTEHSEEETIELATFLREPWLIPLYNKENIIDFLYSVLINSKHTITSLIGEIFTEEERELTKKYEAIINLIGSGIWNTKELTSILYSRGLIPDPSPNHLIQYLKNLEEMGLVENIKLHKTKGMFYRLASPIMNIYYYLDSRYDISNRPISLAEARPTLEKLVNMEIQNFIADLFAELHEGRKEYFVSPDREVDFIITKRNKAEIVGEVKWKKITGEDISKFKRNSERFAGRKVLVCKNGETGESGLDIVNPHNLISMVKKASRKP